MKRINLIPPELAGGRKAFLQSAFSRRLVLGGIILLLILLFHYSVHLLGFIGLKREVNSIKRSLDQAQAVTESVNRSKETVQAQLDALEKQTDSLEQKRERLLILKNQRFKWSDALSEFQKAIPDKVWVDELVLDQPKSLVRGGTFGNQLVGTFIENLNRSIYFTNASFTRTETGTLNKQPVIHFELTFELVKK